MTYNVHRAKEKKEPTILICHCSHPAGCHSVRGCSGQITERVVIDCCHFSYNKKERQLHV